MSSGSRSYATGRISAPSTKYPSGLGLQSQKYAGFFLDEDDDSTPRKGTHYSDDDDDDEECSDDSQYDSSFNTSYSDPKKNNSLLRKHPQSSISSRKPSSSKPSSPAPPRPNSKNPFADTISVDGIPPRARRPSDTDQRSSRNPSSSTRAPLQSCKTGKSTLDPARGVSLMDTRRPSGSRSIYGNSNSSRRIQKEDYFSDDDDDYDDDDDDSFERREAQRKKEFLEEEKRRRKKYEEEKRRRQEEKRRRKYEDEKRRRYEDEKRDISSSSKNKDLVDGVDESERSIRSKKKSSSKYSSSKIDNEESDDGEFSSFESGDEKEDLPVSPRKESRPRPSSSRRLTSSARRYEGDSENRRSSSARAHRSSSRVHGSSSRSKSSRTKTIKSKKAEGVDTIDRLDVTGLFGGAFHHDGPFDACNPHRNKNTKIAPVMAFPIDGPNSTIKGLGPNNSKEHTINTVLGTNNPDFDDDDVIENGYTNDPDTRKAIRNKVTFDAPLVVIDAKTQQEQIHGSTTLGLGSSTFLEGAPASAAAKQEELKFDQAQLSRKKSLSRRLLSSGNNGNVPSRNNTTSNYNSNKANDDSVLKLDSGNEKNSLLNRVKSLKVSRSKY